MDPTRLGVGIIGAGRVGPVLAAALAGAGHHLVGMSKPSDGDLERVTSVVPGITFLDVPDIWGLAIWPDCRSHLDSLRLERLDASEGFGCNPDYAASPHGVHRHQR
jgi:2-polyprenyl-6-methoxyphenol hydroxylase-like FAD-dependent oxidoreductase